MFIFLALPKHRGILSVLDNEQKDWNCPVLPDDNDTPFKESAGPK